GLPETPLSIRLGSACTICLNVSLQNAEKCKSKVFHCALPAEKRYKRGDRNVTEEGHSFMGTLSLEGLKIVAIAVLFAAPTISQNMGDFGAEVIKVEHPRLGDSLRALC